MSDTKHHLFNTHTPDFQPAPGLGSRLTRVRRYLAPTYLVAAKHGTRRWLPCVGISSAQLLDHRVYILCLRQSSRSNYHHSFPERLSRSGSFVNHIRAPFQGPHSASTELLRRSSCYEASSLSHRLIYSRFFRACETESWRCGASH
jgi:hypothetical protein